MKYALRLEFDGAPFCGWQDQGSEREALNKPSIQSTLQQTLKELLSSEETFHVQGCGRTDAGVHAEEYVAHVEIPHELIPKFKSEARRLRLSLNSLLPYGVCVKEAVEVEDSFHALNDALYKQYEYRILIKMTKPVLDKGRVHWIPAEPEDTERFDVELLRTTAKGLIGEKDFAAFASSGHALKSTVRRIRDIQITDELRDRSRGRLVCIRFEGEGFLKQQVRNMVGSLVAVASHKRPADFIERLLMLSQGPKTRIPSLFCAPAEGLFLVKVKYDRSIFPVL